MKYSNKYKKIANNICTFSKPAYICISITNKQPLKLFTMQNFTQTMIELKSVNITTLLMCAVMTCLMLTGLVTVCYQTVKSVKAVK